MTPIDQALAALSGWPHPTPLHMHLGATARRSSGPSEVRATIRLDPDGQWRSSIAYGGSSVGAGTADTPEAALEQATAAARDRLKVLASLLA